MRCFWRSIRREYYMRCQSYERKLEGLDQYQRIRDLHMIDCHIMAEVSIALRPNNRKRTVGEALMNASTIGFERPIFSYPMDFIPFGLMAGARAMNKSTLSFS